MDKDGCISTDYMDCMLSVFIRFRFNSPHWFLVNFMSGPCILVLVGVFDVPFYLKSSEIAVNIHKLLGFFSQYS